MNRLPSTVDGLLDMSFKICQGKKEKHFQQIGQN